MDKDFDKWNKIKKETDNREAIFKFQPRDVWFVRVGENIGFEQSGKGKDFLRPVLMSKKFSKELFWGIPLTSSLKNKDKKYYFAFSSPSYKKQGVAILSQKKLFDSKRLMYIIGYISKEDFSELKDKLIHLIDE